MKHVAYIAVTIIMCLAVAFDSAAETAPPYAFEWGSSGSANGEFDFVTDVAIDSQGNVFVVDSFNHRIQKFSRYGDFLLTWGHLGSSPGEFDYPVQVAVDSQDNVYVLEVSNCRVQKFASDSTYITEWGSPGSGNNQFSGPYGMTVDAQDNVWVGDSGNHRIVKFTSNGTYLTKWGQPGSGDGQLSYPHGLAVDSQVDVYVADYGNYRIQKFDSSGTFLLKWGSYGVGDNQFMNPTGVALDSLGNVFVTDPSDRVQKFNASGDFILSWGTEGSGPGEFFDPGGLEVHPDGRIYVADTWNYRIQVFGPPIPPSATALYVRQDATGGANNGSSWVDAFTDLQSALTAAMPGDSVWVAAATYKPTSGTDRTATFQLTSGVSVFGGFAGFETGISQRDWVANPTVLSGDIGLASDSTDNSYHVVTGSGTNSSAVLDGFTITAGYDDADRSAGGGMLNDVGSPTVRNVVFSRNSATSRGGAIYNTAPPAQSSNPILINVTFLANSSYWGGAMYNDDGCNPVVTNAVFTGNVAGSAGGAIYNQLTSQPVLTNVTISRNTANAEGGGIYNNYASPTMIMTNSIMWGDSAGNAYDEIRGWSPGISYSLVQGGGDDPVLHMIDADPLFVDAANGDLHLSGCYSPAVNTGTAAALGPADSLDIDGHPRIAGGGVDLGAYEFQYPGPTAVAYVDQQATGAADGSSWADAYPELWMALGECATEVWVAAGTYTPTPGTDRSAAFKLRSGVAIYGGFAGGETTLEERDWGSNQTILSGDIGAPGDNTDNSIQVIHGAQVDSTAILDGFTVEAGGNGIYLSDSNPTLANLVVKQNSGGGMYNGNSSPEVVNVMFVTNSGGGANISGGNPAFYNVVFADNSNSGIGGAVVIGGGSPTFTNATFSGNHASWGGGLVNLGAGNPSVTNTILWGDSAQNNPEVLGSFTFYNSLIAGSGGSDAWNTAFGTDGGGNIDGDPLFVDAPGGNLRLRSGSPAINAGWNAAPNLPATDLDGRQRIFGGTVDMGAYESQAIYALTTNVNGIGVVARTPDQAFYAAGDTVVVEAVPDSCWVFAGWSGGLSGTVNPDTVIVTSDTSVTATFTQKSYTLTANAVGNGSVLRTPDQTSYLCGDTVYVQAVPDPCWQFTGWSGGLTGAENPDTVVVTSDTTVTATFTQYTYAINVNAVGGGSATKTPDLPAYPCGDAVIVEAFPDPGRIFAGWSGGLNSQENPDTLLAEGDTTVTATFLPDTFTVTVATNPPGLQVRVDNVAYTAPRIFTSAYADSHLVGVTTPQAVGDTVFVFNNWSDGDTLNHWIVTPDSSVTYTAAFDRYFKFALIDSIVDIPNDQGGWVRIHLTRSVYDDADEQQYPIATYNVWRRVSSLAAAQAIVADGEKLDSDDAISLMFPDAKDPVAVAGLPLIGWQGRYFLLGSEQNGMLPPGTWEIIGSFAAAQLQHYTYATTTLADSSDAGVTYTSYAVSAHSTTPAVWFMSAPDSGYSVDNIAPAPPQSFSVAYNTGAGNHLGWAPSPDADFQYFRVYRSTDPAFTPTPADLIYATTSTEWSDPDYDDPSVSYKVTAVDHAGNESTPSSDATPSAAPQDVPTALALYPNVPNPFNPSTVIRYDVPPSTARVVVAVFDVRGRLVRTLVDGPVNPGQRSVQWDGRDNRGTLVSSGIYFCRLDGGGTTQVRKMVLLK